MQLGDSLVDIIFEEGIKNCDVFIIILSKFSIVKKWVKEELDSMVVKRIEDNTKLIPIVIDGGIDIPQSIRHILRKTIRDLSDYEQDFNEIVMSIYGVSDIPPVANQPTFVTEFSTIGDLSKADSMMLKFVGDYILGKNDVGRMAHAADMINQGMSHGLTKEQCATSLEVLETNGYWKITRTLGGIEQSHIIMPAWGFIEYSEHCIDNYRHIFMGTVSAIFNDKFQITEQIAEKMKCKLIVVNSIVDIFENHGYVRLTRSLGRKSSVIYDITGAGKRYFEHILSNI